jgi:L-aminopeptidase/D-esterase-like protein
MLGTIKVGHADDPVALTGCTVFLPPEGTVGACEVRGGGPATRETELLRPMCMVTGPNAILLTGGSAFGLGAAGGVVRFLEEKGIGFPTSAGAVPIVSAAAIFDLDIGDPGVRPDEEMAYSACGAATVDEAGEGSVGVGMGARVALQGHNGIARATRPSHTRFDGDTVFVLATGEVEAPTDAIEVLASMGTAEALRSAVMRAAPGGGLPCARDILER